MLERRMGIVTHMKNRRKNDHPVICVTSSPLEFRRVVWIWSLSFAASFSTLGEDWCAVHGSLFSASAIMGSIVIKDMSAKGRERGDVIIEGIPKKAVIVADHYCRQSVT